jgi:hypothetical protein
VDVPRQNTRDFESIVLKASLETTDLPMRCVRYDEVAESQIELGIPVPRRLLAQHIKARAADFAVGQRACERVIIDDSTSRAIDQQRCRLHEREFLRPD